MARSGRQRSAARDNERKQIHSDRDRLLLQVGGGCADAVVPPSACGQTHRGHRRPLRIPVGNPLQTAASHSPQGERTTAAELKFHPLFLASLLHFFLELSDVLVNISHLYRLSHLIGKI